MTLYELIQKADKGYRISHCDSNGENPTSTLLDFVDENGKENGETGDTLALFVIRELKDTFDVDADDETQIQEAVRVLNQAQNDLQNAINALEKDVVFVCPICDKHETPDDLGYKCTKCGRYVCQECIVLSQGCKCEECLGKYNV